MEVERQLHDDVAFYVRAYPLIELWRDKPDYRAVLAEYQAAVARSERHRP